MKSSSGGGLSNHNQTGLYKLEGEIEAIKREINPKEEPIKGIEKAELSKANSAPNGSQTFEKVKEEETKK